MSVIAVIGAGPAGSHYAGLEAAKGNEVHLFEAKKVVGKPVACTGILTVSAYGVTDIPQGLTISTIDKFRIRSLDGKFVDVKLDKQNFVLDRAKFDQYLCSQAVKKGAKLHKGYEFVSYKQEGKQIIVKFKNGKSFKTDYLVGADGPFSPVAKVAGIYGKREFLQGLQVRAKGKFEPGTTEIVFGLGEFAWIVAETKTIARIGVIGKSVKKEFNILLKDYKIIEDQSGPIPLYNPKQVLQKGNIALIGDAATQVKATTYGGIIYGLLAGKYLSEDWKGYTKAFNKKLGKDLWISLKMRQAMNKFSDEDCKELIAIFEKENNRKFLESNDRDFPSKFIVQLLMKEAKLWKLGFKLFK